MKTSAQDSLKFVTIPFDFGVKNYTVQDSVNSAWNNVKVIKPKKKADSNIYLLRLKTQNVYYRLVSNMLSGKPYLTNIFYLGGAINNATITTTKYKHTWFADKLSFKVVNPINIAFYLIERSTNGGITWTYIDEVTTVTSNTYTNTLVRLFSKKPLYRVTVVYLDNTMGEPVMFK